MSAEILRRAASLMRERAEVATGATCHWKTGPSSVGRGQVACGQVCVAITDETLGGGADNAEHIASWHPAVALAVADWLDACAFDAEAAMSEGIRPYDDDEALAVARAYLGES